MRRRGRPTWPSTPTLLALSFCALLLVSSVPVSADGCAQPFSDQATAIGTNTMTLDLKDRGGGINTTASDNAAHLWNDCPGLPSVSRGTGGDLNIEVNFMPGAPTASDCGSGCGCSRISYSVDSNGNKTVAGAQIFLFKEAPLIGVADCSPGTEKTLAHEIGHVMGLQEAPSSGCNGRIMTGFDPNKTVTSGDCAGADDLWLIDPEIEDPDPDHPCQFPQS